MKKEDSVIVIGLHRIVAEMDHQTKQLCKEYGLTLGQFAVLEALHHKGELTVGELKDLVLSTDGTIPVVIGNLEKEGLVTRTQDEHDKRKFIIALTKEGAGLITKVYPKNEEMLEEMLGVLGAKEKQSLVDAIRILKNRS